MASTSSDRDQQGRLGKNDPRSLGDYEIVRRIATGGMAEVYLARHGKIAGLKTLVVIKRILPHLARDEQFTAMFLDEARIVASLDHPNVVRTIEVGVDDEEYFLAMELVQGETMSRVLGAAVAGGQRLDPPLGAYIVARAAAGLHHAHTLHDADGAALRVVHRDVSPENILVSFEGAVKVIDFGVARSANRVNQTLHGGPKGKAGYMAPEQARGDPLDQRADIFSLGVVLWEVLVGRRLFRRENDLASLRAIIEEPAPKLADVAPAAAALDGVLSRALEKDPAYRLESAAELAEALDAFVGSGKSIGPSDLSAFMNRALPEQRARWRDMTRSAMALGHDPSTLRLPTLVRRNDDFVIDEEEDFEEPDTVRDDRVDVVTAARTPPVREPVALPVAERSRGLSSGAKLVIAAAVCALVGFAIVMVLRSRGAEVSSVAPPAPIAPSVHVDPLPAPPPPEPEPPRAEPPVAVQPPVVAEPPPPAPVVARPAAPPKKPSVRKPPAPRPTPRSSSGFKPNPFD